MKQVFLSPGTNSSSFYALISESPKSLLEEVMDRISHLEHLQAVLKKFNPNATFNKDVLI